MSDKREKLGTVMAYPNGVWDKAKEETRLRLYMEAMEEVFQRAGRKIIIDPDVKGVLPFLDLDPGAKGDAR